MIKQGSKVTLDYEGRFEDGKVFDSSKHGDHSHPLEFVVGAGQVIPGFEKAVIGMKKGEEKEITIEPKDAYGEPNPDMLKEVPLEAFQGQQPKEGMMLMLGSPDGKKFPARIAKVGKDSVTIDLNHPLAGKKLIFKIKILGIEEKSSKENVNK